MIQYAKLNSTIEHLKYNVPKKLNMKIALETFVSNVIHLNDNCNYSIVYYKVMERQHNNIRRIY